MCPEMFLAGRKHAGPVACNPALGSTRRAPL